MIRLSLPSPRSSSRRGTVGVRGVRAKDWVPRAARAEVPLIGADCVGPTAAVSLCAWARLAPLTTLLAWLSPPPDEQACRCARRTRQTVNLPRSKVLDIRSRRFHEWAFPMLFSIDRAIEELHHKRTLGSLHSAGTNACFLLDNVQTSAQVAACRRARCSQRRPRRQIPVRGAPSGRVVRHLHRPGCAIDWRVRHQE